jgi:hypothetical protein
MKRQLVTAVTITALMAGIMITSCKSSKPSVQKGSVEVSIPLSGKEYWSNKDYFRASQSGKSPNLPTAKKIALQNAKTELAGNIQTVIKAVTENYTNQRTVSDVQEFENKFEENARAVVNQSLDGIIVIGEKTFKEVDGSYTYYIAVEVDKETLVNKVTDRISKDAKLRLDFDKHQFQKVFDEEMAKFENR